MTTMIEGILGMTFATVLIGAIVCYVTLSSPKKKKLQKK